MDISLYVADERLDHVLKKKKKKKLQLRDHDEIISSFSVSEVEEFNIMIIVKDNVSKSIVVEDKIKVDDVLQVPVNKDKKVGETVHYSFVRKDKSKNDRL